MKKLEIQSKQTQELLQLIKIVIANAIHTHGVMAIISVAIAEGKEIVIFYIEILTGKVVLWCFFTSETSEKIHKSTFEGKISVQNVIFSNEMEK